MSDFWFWFFVWMFITAFGIWIHVFIKNNNYESRFTHLKWTLLTSQMMAVHKLPDAYRAFGVYRCPHCEIDKEALYFRTTEMVDHKVRANKLLSELLMTHDIVPVYTCYLCKNNRYIGADRYALFKIRGCQDKLALLRVE